jgi:hypothetical protein
VEQQQKPQLLLFREQHIPLLLVQAARLLLAFHKQVQEAVHRHSVL